MTGGLKTLCTAAYKFYKTQSTCISFIYTGHFIMELLTLHAFVIEKEYWQSPGLKILFSSNITSYERTSIAMLR